MKTTEASLGHWHASTERLPIGLETSPGPDCTPAEQALVWAALNPYLLGATPTAYGNPDTAGVADPYVPRTHDDVDARLQQVLEPGRLVLLVGPSTAGKTRTAFEAVRTRWPGARLLSPAPQALAALGKHPRLRTSTDTVVVWLDDLPRYLAGIPEPLSPALLTSLLARPGPILVVATLRTEERALLTREEGELTHDTRRLLAESPEVVLGPTSDDPQEQAAARAAYGAEDLSRFGLAEQLAGAPALLRQYRDARHADPLLHSVIRTVIDWTRVGMPDPLPEKDLAEFALDALAADRPEIRTSSKKARKAIEAADTPPAGAGRVAALETRLLPNRTRAYRPFSYLVAADDGQVGPPRTIPENMWDEALERADPLAAHSVGVAAYYRGNFGVAQRAYEQAATAENTEAMFSLGILLAEQDPPDAAGVRLWWERAAHAGHTRAMNNLGVMLAGQDPPDTAGARRWYEQAAHAGAIDSMVNLGNLLLEQDPPDLKGVRRWWEQAADAGDTGAMNNLGNLLLEQNPPDLKGARRWWEQATKARHSKAKFNLWFLLAGQDPPDLPEARHWYEQAAAAEDTDAMVLLGNLLAGRILRI